MRKGFRYNDGTFVMEGTEAWELKHNPPSTMKVPGARAGLDQHMKMLDDKWRKLEGRKPVAELNMREKMLEGRIPWDPVLLKVLSFVDMMLLALPKDNYLPSWKSWELVLGKPEVVEKLLGICKGEPAFYPLMFWGTLADSLGEAMITDHPLLDHQLMQEPLHTSIRNTDDGFAGELKSVTDNALKDAGVPTSDLSTGLSVNDIIKEDIELLGKDVWEQLGGKPENLTDIVVRAKLDNFLDKLPPDTIVGDTSFVVDGVDLGFKGVRQIGNLVISEPLIEPHCRKNWEESSPYLFKYFKGDTLLCVERVILDLYPVTAHPFMTDLVQKAIGIRFRKWEIQWNTYVTLCRFLLTDLGTYIPFKEDEVVHGILRRSKHHPSGIKVNHPDGKY